MGTIWRNTIEAWALSGLRPSIRPFNHLIVWPRDPTQPWLLMARGRLSRGVQFLVHPCPELKDLLNTWAMFPGLSPKCPVRQAHHKTGDEFLVQLSWNQTAPSILKPRTRKVQTQPSLSRQGLWIYAEKEQSFVVLLVIVLVLKSPKTGW